ncbi:hypothetical protein F8388_005782 [Cannabis sativa]|uniref:CCHC-type domain-containing protein n=1 Tax=Cannabis sativa TaxID=3483 RepID=A0A7J6HML3_CANSA|nr:hypothetical protein F8388_005782 [Cannabis sativa]
MLNMPATMDTTDATMEDLLAKTTNLTVLDEDGWEINMAGGTEVASLCAMGRFCSNRPISRSLLRTILGRVWGIADRNWGVEIKHTIKEASFLVFSFKSSQDLDKILTKNPWFLNNGLLIVERMTEMPINWDKVLTKFPLSGRILNLPTSSITQGNLNRLAGFAGDTIEVQKADLTKIVTKGFFTFKVWCDINIPLCAGFLFSSEGRKVWLPFRYDCLPFMCFKCGFVGHDTRICAEPITMIEDGMGNRTPGYGAWLKVEEGKGIFASPIQRPPPQRTPPIPPGFYEKKSYSCNSMADMGGQNIAVGSPSMARPELTSSKMMNPTTNPTIQGLKTVDKGKAIAMTDPVGQLISEQQVLKGKHNHTQQADLHGISGKLTNTKRSGSWRNEEFNNIFKDHNLFNSQHKNGLQGPAIDSLNIDTESLLDVPVTYTTGCDFLSKIEGPTKRRKNEDICHALWHCPKVQNIWKLFGFPKLIPLNLTKAADVLWWLHEHLPNEEFFKFMGLTWLVWQRRNNFVFQHKILDEKIWTSWAIDLISTHLEPHQKTSKNPAMKLNSAWIPPQQNYFLINTDASLIAGQQGCGLSAVIRDPKGGLVVAATSFIPGCLSVLLAEANAVHLGIQLAIRWSITNAQVGSDSHSLIKALNSDTSYPTDWGQLVQDIKLLRNKFQTLQFLFFTRSCNRVANSLAKWSHLTQKSEMWTDLLPNCAAAFLIADVPSVA